MGLNDQHGPRIIQKLNLILLSFFLTNNICFFFIQIDHCLSIEVKKNYLTHLNGSTYTTQIEFSNAFLSLYLTISLQVKPHLKHLFINEPEIWRWKNIEANMYKFPYKSTLTLQKIEYFLVKIER